MPGARLPSRPSGTSSSPGRPGRPAAGVATVPFQGCPGTARLGYSASMAILIIVFVPVNTDLSGIMEVLPVRIPR